MASMNNQRPAEYTGATIQSFNGNRLTDNRPIMNPLELFYGDSYLKLTGRSSLQAASPDQVLFNFHLREYCEWLRPPNMSSPVCITNTSVLHWSSSDHFHNFTNVEASRRSVHSMLTDIPFRAESKELWKLAIALFSRLMVNRITDERCRVVEIDVKVVAMTRRLIAPNVRRTMVERLVLRRESGRFMGTPIVTPHTALIWNDIFDAASGQAPSTIRLATQF